MSRVQEKARIGAKEMTAMMTLLVSAHLFLNYPRYASISAMEAAWMEPIAAGAISLTLFLIVEKIFRSRFNRMDIVDVCRLGMGKFGAQAVAVVLSLFFLLLTANIMRQFTENVIATVLPDTPILVVTALFIGAITYVAFCGLEGVARVSYIALPVLLLGVAALCLMTANWWNPALLFPFWGNGIPAIANGAFFGSSVFTNVLLLCIIYPHANDPKAFRQVGVVSILLTVILLVAFITCYHMIFSPYETTKLTSPVYSVARIIHMGRFVQRLESVFVFMWVSAAVVKMSITLWAGAYLLASAFEWPTYRPMLPALALLCVALSLVPSDISTVLEIDREYFMRWTWIFVYVVPLVVLVVGMFRRGGKRRRVNHA